MKHVYILGAGFSAPLGGPLFKQLLTNELNFYWQALKLKPGWHDTISRIHDGWFQKAYGRPLDAEQVLEKIDWMSHHDEPISRYVSSQIIPESLGAIESDTFLTTLRRVLKSVLAAECQAFLSELDEQSDVWDPYDAWFATLTANDTIITFNYDTVIETLAERAGNPYNRAGFGTIRSTQPMLLKLHGSVEWIKSDTAEGLRFVENGYKEALELALGTPGIEKATMHEKGRFRTLWDLAKTEIRDATCISVVGYSMPPTDNRARMMILQQIAEGREKKQRFNIVLGPQSGDKTAMRIKSLIEPVMPYAEWVRDLPLYAQDYLPNVERYSQPLPKPEREPTVRW